jgi:hypothetical protein
MKTKKHTLHIIGTFFFLLFISSGCKKETLSNAIPVLKMISVKPLGLDSVIVTGTITANYGVDILYEGFCYGTNPIPPVIENQVLYQTDSTTFSAHLYASHDSTYYFRCIAANSFGYSVSAPLK